MKRKCSATNTDPELKNITWHTRLTTEINKRKEEGKKKKRENTEEKEEERKRKEREKKSKTGVP